MMDSLEQWQPRWPGGTESDSDPWRLGLSRWPGQIVTHRRAAGPCLTVSAAARPRRACNSDRHQLERPGRDSVNVT